MAQQEQPAPDVGRVDRILNYLLGRPQQPEDAAIHPIFIPQAAGPEIDAAIERVNRTAELVERLTPYDVDTAVAYLDVRMYGQKITDRYRAQCATLLTQEMDRQGLHNIRRRKPIITEAIEIHIRERIRTELRWRFDDIEAVNKFNGAIEGTVERRHPWFYWKTERTQLAGSLNILGPWQDDSSFRLSHILAPVALTVGANIGVAAVGWGIYQLVKRLTSPHSCGQIACYTTLNTVLQHLPLTQNGINPNPQQNMTIIDRCYKHIRKFLCHPTPFSRAEYIAEIHDPSARRLYAEAAGRMDIGDPVLASVTPFTKIEKVKATKYKAPRMIQGG
ncbi:unnamed protein product [Parnassius apollo]|uniref:(apollo) hypothetical protein n=1 Tax=Parnassius apollo TaxID=110799 RepID=A0A8S3VZJ0_PARAO|nr:unnamed protein product [Parnassius apollo]